MSAADDDRMMDRVIELVDEAIETGRTTFDRSFGAMVVPDLVLVELIANGSDLLRDGVALRRIADGRAVLLVAIPTEVTP